MSKKIQITISDEVAAVLERRARMEGRKMSGLAAWWVTMAASNASMPGASQTSPSAVAVFRPKEDTP